MLIGDKFLFSKVRGGALFRQLYRSYYLFLKFVKKIFGNNYCNLFLIIEESALSFFFWILISGLVFLFYYKASIYSAYNSLFLGDWIYIKYFIHSFHHYASDACLFFVFIHAVRMLSEVKFIGGRAFSWIVGVLLSALLWLTGWIGFFLTWSILSGRIGIISARALDFFPIFPDSIERSFLVEQTIGSLLFFLAFLFHIALAIFFFFLFWLHIKGLRKVKFIPRNKVLVYTFILLSLASFFMPVVPDGRANLLYLPNKVGFDGFYLWFLPILEKLTSKQIWLIGFVLIVGPMLLPLLGKAKLNKVYVEEKRCHGCRQCFEDCPYNAIEMRKGSAVKDIKSFIDNNKCVECGICVGSCDPSAIVYQSLPVFEMRAKLTKWLKADKRKTKAVAFLCGHSVAMDLDFDEESGRSKKLKEYIVIPLPCVSWMHPVFIERAVRGGANKILVVGCGENVCYSREGSNIFKERLSGKREPYLRKDKIKGVDLKYVHFSPGRLNEFIRFSEGFLRGNLPSSIIIKSPSSLFCSIFFAFFFLLFFKVFGATFSYSPFNKERAEFAVSVRYAGRFIDQVTESNASVKLDHMKGANIGLRSRHVVVVKVYLDNKEYFSLYLKPSGIFSDGESKGFKIVNVPLGEHLVTVKLDDNEDRVWDLVESKVINFQNRHRVVLLIERGDALQWFLP